jgi:hypothetical protein
MKAKFESQMTPTVQEELLRLWNRVGFLQGLVEVLEGRIRELEGSPAVVIDAQEPHGPEDGGNLICFPGVMRNGAQPGGPPSGRRRR